MTYFVYILKLKDNSLYTGYTNNIPRRMKEHAYGRGSKYVKSRLPLHLTYFESFNTQRDAMRRELKIKKMSKSQKVSLIGKS